MLSRLISFCNPMSHHLPMDIYDVSVFIRLFSSVVIPISRNFISTKVVIKLKIESCQSQTYLPFNWKYRDESRLKKGIYYQKNCKRTASVDLHLFLIHYTKSWKRTLNVESIFGKLNTNHEKAKGMEQLILYRISWLR